MVTLDNAKRANADITTDILLWEFWKIPRGYFQLVAAGPPCQEYSQAKTVGVRDMVGADKLVRKTLEIIKHFQPLLWWVENPRGGLLKTRGLLDSFHFVDVDYCQFGDWGYQKPTRVWGSAQLGRLAPRLCNPQCPNKNPHTGRHFQQLGGYGPQLTAWEKGRMPSKLVEYLLSSAPEIGPPRSRSVVWKKEPTRTCQDNKSSPPLQKWVREVVVPLYALKTNRSAQLTELQLVLPLTLDLGRGQVVRVKALVDTGAQANLINEELIPKNCMRWARDQLHLVAANGLSIPGGNFEVKAQTTLQKVTRDGGFVGVQHLGVSLHVAQLSLDAILSYPWLAENGLLVDPQRNTLSLPHPEQVFLKALEPGPKGKALAHKHHTHRDRGVSICMSERRPNLFPGRRQLLRQVHSNGRRRLLAESTEGGGNLFAESSLGDRLISVQRLEGLGEGKTAALGESTAQTSAPRAKLGGGKRFAESVFLNKGLSLPTGCEAATDLALGPKGMGGTRINHTRKPGSKEKKAGLLGHATVQGTTGKGGRNFARSRGATNRGCLRRRRPPRSTAVVG